MPIVSTVAPERELDEAVDGQATAPPFGVEADLAAVEAFCVWN